MPSKKWVHMRDLRPVLRTVDLNKVQVQNPWEADPDECRQYILLRIEMNLEATGHPFHHRAADGTIVDTDPSLEYAISRLTDAKPAVPVNRNFYGVDPFTPPSGERA